MPLDFHGVPQHSDGSPSGQVRATDARLHSVANAAVAPGPPSAGPNIVPVQDANSTASACLGRRARARGDPPRGRSGDHAGSTSGSITLRPSAVAPATSGDGSTAATSSATAAARVAPAQCRAAAAHPAPAPAAGLLLPQPLDEVTGVDQHRARRLAHAVDRAGVDARVAVVVLELRDERGVARGLGPLHLAAQHDPLPRRGGEVAARAHRLAEAALHAPVDLGLDLVDGLEVLQVARRGRR